MQFTDPADLFLAEDVERTAISNGYHFYEAFFDKMIANYGWEHIQKLYENYPQSFKNLAEAFKRFILEYRNIQIERNPEPSTRTKMKEISALCYTLGTRYSIPEFVQLIKELNIENPGKLR
jgi:hypothetical protein